MKEVTWSSGGLVLFIVKKIQLEETFLEQPFCGTRHLLGKREREQKRESEILSCPLSLSLFLRLLPPDKSEGKR